MKTFSSATSIHRRERWNPEAADKLRVYITDHLPEIENALQDEQRSLLNKILDAQGELDTISELDSFIVGFRLGAAFTYDTFVNTDTPYRDLTEKL